MSSSIDWEGFPLSVFFWQGTDIETPWVDAWAFTLIEAPHFVGRRLSNDPEFDFSLDEDFCLRDSLYDYKTRGETHFPLHNHHLPQILTFRISQPHVSSFIHISGRTISRSILNVNHLHFKRQEVFFSTSSATSITDTSNPSVAAMPFTKFLLTDFTFKNRDCQQTTYELVSRGKYHRIPVMRGGSTGGFMGVTSFFILTSRSREPDSSPRESHNTELSSSIVLKHKQPNILSSDRTVTKSEMFSITPMCTNAQTHATALLFPSGNHKFMEWNFNHYLLFLRYSLKRGGGGGTFDKSWGDRSLKRRAGGEGGTGRGEHRRTTQ